MISNGLMAGAVVAFVALGIPGVLAAAEVASPLTPSAPQNWTRQHRERYQLNTLQLDGPGMIAAMPQVISFAEAAKYNIRNNRPSEYTTVPQRNALYDLVSLVLEYDPGTAASKRGVRFFHAATAVTARLPLGAVDWLPGYACDGLTDDVRQLLRSINAGLLAHNMPILRRLLLEWPAPRNPTGGTGNISPWDFDLAMVDYEQAEVTRLLAQINPTPAVRTDLNRMMNACDESAIARRLGRFTLPVSVQPWLTAVGILRVNFFDEVHRRALGKAIVTVFHRRTEADFRRAIGFNP